MLLTMNHIYKEYPVGKESLLVLKDVCLEVEQGDYLAIMGPSGSGKTTLMNLIGCLDVPTSGSYILNGTEIATCSQNALADIRNHEIGFVFQSFNLIGGMSALENVELPLLYAGVHKSERRRRAEEALQMVGLEERMHFKPKQLSGGQSQRVAIARAIVGHPGLLLADEPTGALDSVNGASVMELFQKLHENGSTILMITHDQKIASYAHRQASILDGVLKGGLLHE